MLAEDWTYLAEGNNNIIFSNVRNGQVLRLPKITKRKPAITDNARYHNGVTENHVISREMDFLENVVYRLMDNFAVNYRAEKRAVTPTFLRELSLVLKSRQPLNNRSGKLDESATHGLVMPNYCRSLLLLPQNICSVPIPIRPPIISIEIRPKSCYIPVLRNVDNEKLNGMCFFCMVRTYLKLQGRKEPQTKYCPFDLYSGNVSRMKRALGDLITTPQRYFSVRVNDEPLSRKHFKNENFTEAQKIKHFSELVGPFFHPNNDEQGLEIFIDLLCTIFRLPVTTDSRFKPVTTSRAHCRRAFNEADNCTSDMNNSLHHRSDMPGVTSDRESVNVLDFFSAMQAMRNIPIDDVMDMQRKRVEYLSKHPEDEAVLSLNCPYSAWKNATNGSNLPKTSGLQDRDSIVKIAQILRRFIIARGFSCCSVIISLQRTTTEDIDSPIKGTFYVNDKNGNKYVASIAMLDFYKETSNQILKFCEREIDVISYLNSNWK